MLIKSRSWSCLALTGLQVIFGVGFWNWKIKPAVSAEDIILNYKALEFTIAVDDLETYARTGKLTGALKSYGDLLTPEQLAQFKVGLTSNVEFDHLAIAQFLYSFQGEKILERVSRVIETKARQPGFYAIRSALILAAADREGGGLSPLNVLRKFPTKALRIDSSQGFKMFKDLSRVVQTNERAIAAIEQSARQETRQTMNVTPQVRNLNLLMPGRYKYQKEQLTMKDQSRDRSFPVDLYLPKAKFLQPFSLIIISHGLGSDLTTFAYLAQHLASHGFAVAVPEHPGSNASQIQSLLTGLDADVTPPEELIDRPLDIKFLLDRLEEQYSEKIDTNNVGMLGQSFGAYTTLALAGAEINLDTLQASCLDFQNSWNISLLLQCLALQLPPEDLEINLKDERIKTAIAINPFTSAIFGQENLAAIELPLAIVAGSSDPITPALSEQIIPFTWLEIPEKYLVLLKGGTHFSTLNESSGSIPVPQKAIGPDPKIAQAYIKQLALAMFAIHIQNQPQYARYLNAEYGTVISKDKMPLSIIESLDIKALELQSVK